MARIRPWVVALAGTGLTAAAVAFFLVTSVRSDHLLRDGVRAQATVVRTDGPSAWPLFNNGRVIVRYATDSGVLTRRIWLDDAADLPRTPTWTVVYDARHPGRVRSETDGNDPYPWAAPALLAGAVGVLAMIGGTWAAWRGSRRRRGATAPGPADAARFPLRHPRLYPRVPYLAVGTGEVRLHLPTMFGPRDLTVPTAAVCVTTGVTGLDDPGEGWVFVDPVCLPYAVTTSPLAPPNLTLLFTAPQRVPPLRYLGAQTLGLSWRASRSQHGVTVDGLALRAEDPDGAVAALAAAGVARTTRPAAWLREHRTITHDPVEIADVAKDRRRWRLVSALSFAVVIGLQGVRLLPDRDFPVAILVLVAGLALIVGLPRWAERRQRARREG